MSIVEKALQKAQVKTDRPATRDAAAPTPDPAPGGHRPPGRATQPATPDVAAPGARPARGGTVALDFVQLRQDGRLAPEALSHQTEEEFRRIKWPILNAIAHREGARPAENNIVLVTSAIPGEGKTFTALNLALSFARDRDLEVLLVDGDVAQPSLTASLGLTGRPGITNLLRDTSLQLDDLVYSTNIPQLEVVPSGARQDNAPELFASARMAVIVAQLCARASPGVVIVDSPPVLATNEAQVMTRYAGQVLMVVRADYTEQRVLAEALTLIDRARPVSAVLNRVEPSLVSRYYSHYYYGYGKGPTT
jgi:exopolysaccharide/PEP-CTERM locus tyrosine autokinase